MRTSNFKVINLYDCLSNTNLVANVVKDPFVTRQQIIRNNEVALMLKVNDLIRKYSRENNLNLEIKYQNLICNHMTDALYYTCEYSNAINIDKIFDSINEKVFQPYKLFAITVSNSKIIN
jgi:hypothetical protein